MCCPNESEEPDLQPELLETTGPGERGGGGGEGYPTRNRAGDAPAAHRTLITETTTNESPTEEHLRIEGRATEEAARDACNMEPKPRGWPKDLELSATGKQELTETRQVPG